LPGPGPPPPLLRGGQPVPAGPVEVAPQARAPVPAGLLLPEPHDRYVAVGDTPIFLTPTSDHEADVQRAMEQILATFEGFIRRFPDQWHVLEPIWTGEPVPAGVTFPSPPAQAAVGE